MVEDHPWWSITKDGSKRNHSVVLACTLIRMLKGENEVCFRRLAVTDDLFVDIVSLLSPGSLWSMLEAVLATEVVEVEEEEEGGGEAAEDMRAKGNSLV